MGGVLSPETIPALQCRLVCGAANNMLAGDDAPHLLKSRGIDYVLVNGEVVIEADSPQGGFVVLNDLWHRWWQADIDGMPAPVLKANVLFRAVEVPAGKHTVRFVFRPIRGVAADLHGDLLRHLR